MQTNLDITKELWNDDDTEKFDNETYNHLLMEQYKVYVEMADRINARRSLANTFFLTFHAVIISILGLSLSRSPSVVHVGLLLFPLIGLLVLCYAWWRLVQYFRRLSHAKSQVIGELEKRLPSSPSWLAERKALQLKRPYNPLRRMEITLPFIFAALYLFSFVYMVIFTLA